ncbi:hypothetical protein FQZ97_778860 [compost metagenome]
MPDRCGVAANRHFKQRFNDLEQPGEHLGRGEIGFDFLLTEGVARLLEFFTDVGPVPGLRVGQAKIAGGESAQVRQVLVGVRARLARQIAQELDHLFGRFGHLGHQRHVAKVPVAQQLRFFMAQGQQLSHDGCVVKLQCLRGRLVAGPRDVGPVELFAQRAAVGELHDRQVARHLEGQLVPRLAFGLGRGGRGLQHIGRNARQLVGGHDQRKRVGRVQRVFAEFLPQLGLALLQPGKTFLGLALQFCTAQYKAAHGVFVRLRLLRVEAGRIHGLVLGVEAFVRAEPGPEFGDLGQGFVVGGAQLGRVGHTVEVADGTPGARKALGGHVQRAGNGGPFSRERIRRDMLQRAVGVGQQDVQRRSHLVWRDGVETRQIGKIQQGQGGAGRSLKVHAVSDGARQGKFKPLVAGGIGSLGALLDALFHDFGALDLATGCEALVAQDAHHLDFGALTTPLAELEHLDVTRSRHALFVRRFFFLGHRAP